MSDESSPSSQQQPSRKRQCLVNDKEAIANIVTSSKNAADSQVDFDLGSTPPLSSNSVVQDLLSVPLSFLFHSTAIPLTTVLPSSTAFAISGAKRRRRHLLTRNEASLLLHTSQLAQEFDVLLNMTWLALERVCTSRSHSRLFLRNDTNGDAIFCYARPLQTLYQLHSSTFSSAIALHCREDTSHILVELEKCASTLRQFSDQNWSVAEQLLSLIDLTGSDDIVATTGIGSSNLKGNALGREKRIVAQVEEAICVRIERLIALSSHDNNKATSGPNDKDQGKGLFEYLSSMGEDQQEEDEGDFEMLQQQQCLSMKDFCHQLLAAEAENEASFGLTSISEQNSTPLQKADNTNGAKKNNVFAPLIRSTDDSGLMDLEKNGHTGTNENEFSYRNCFATVNSQSERAKTADCDEDDNDDSRVDLPPKAQMVESTVATSALHLFAIESQVDVSS